MTFKQSQGHQTYNENVYLNQVMQSLKDLALMVSEENPTLIFFSNEEICQLSPLNKCENKE